MMCLPEMNEEEMWAQTRLKREQRLENPLPWDIFDGCCACHPLACEASRFCNDCFAEVEWNG